MTVRLEKATEADAEAIWDMQVKAFAPLLDKYRDYDTNPANEKIDRVIDRINHPNGGFYKIVHGEMLTGAICAYWKGSETEYWISPMFISPEFQGKGIAQSVLRLIEGKFPQAETWELWTIREEERNCNLYEKMGYRPLGEEQILNEKTSLVHYIKSVRFHNKK